jgi:hypothetical protein
MTAMRISAAGRKAIAQREGNKLKAYLDSVGVWTIGVGHTSAAGALLVSMRFITLTYMAPVLLVLFGFLAWRTLRDRRVLPQLANCTLSGMIILLVAAPLLFMARHEMVKYYVVGHLTGAEKAIRAKEVGISSAIGHLVYYPGNILKSHLGETFRVVAGLAIALSLIYGTHRIEHLRRRLPDFVLLAVLVIVPIAVLTANESKSPVVGNIVIGPIVLFVVLLAASPIRKASAGYITASVAVILAVLAFLPHAVWRQHSLSVAGVFCDHSVRPN